MVKEWGWALALITLLATVIILIGLLSLAGVQTDTDVLDRYADIRTVCIERGDITVAECQQIALIWMVK